MTDRIKFGLFCTIIWILWKAFSFSPQAGMIAIIVLIILQFICNLSAKADTKRRKIIIQPINDIEYLKLDNKGIKSSINFMNYFIIGICLCVVFMVIFFDVNPMALGLIPIFIFSEYIYTRSGSLKYLDDKNAVKEITFNKHFVAFIINNKNLELKAITNVKFEIFEEPLRGLLLLFSRFSFDNNACVCITFESNNEIIELTVPNLGSAARIKEILQNYHIGINYIGSCESRSTEKILGWNDSPEETTNSEKGEFIYDNEPEVFGNLESENSKLFVLCPNCGMKYGTDSTTDVEIKILNFDDEDPNIEGQQIHCLKCGQKFTVPKEK